MVSEIERSLGDQGYEVFKGIKIKSLKREGDVYDFVDVHPLVKDIYDSMKSLEKYPEYWNYLSADFKNSVLNNFKQFIAQVLNIQNFDPRTGNPNDQKRNIENNIRNIYHDLSLKLFPNLNNYLLSKAPRTRRLNEIQNRLEELINDAEGKQKEISEITKSIKKASAKTGISEFDKIFIEESENNKETAKKWLIVSIVSTLFVAIYLFLLVNGLPPFFGGLISLGIDYTHLAISNVIILTVASYLIYQFFRNYNVNMHLHTINKHRGNCLRTFETFYSASNEPKVKDSVLIQATRAIFETGETGFVTSKYNKNPIELLMNRNSE